MLIYVLQLCVHRPLVFGPVGEDVSHGPTGLVEAQVEAIGVNLGAVCDFEHGLEANSFLPCGEKRRGGVARSRYIACRRLDVSYGWHFFGLPGKGSTSALTDVAVFVFAFGAAAHVTYGPDVFLLEASLVIKNGDAVFLQHEGQRWSDTSV